MLKCPKKGKKEGNKKRDPFEAPLKCIEIDYCIFLSSQAIFSCFQFCNTLKFMTII
jgi:hypothetical protein